MKNETVIERMTRLNDTLTKRLLLNVPLLKHADYYVNMNHRNGNNHTPNKWRVRVRTQGPNRKPA